MANTSGEVYTAGHFGWSIPHISTIFPNKSNIWLSPPCTCCGAEWKFLFMRRRHSVHIQLIRRVKKHGHRNNAICKFIKIDGDGAEQDFGEPVCNIFEEVMNLRSASTEYKFLFNVPTDISARITCLIECYDCKSVTPALLPKSSGNLGRDLMELLTSGEDSDVTISVKDREFKVHKIIIRARSPVFFSMLKHDMVEKRTGKVDIPDCDPEVFQKFLEYVYSGELKELSKDIVCSLYDIADKYQVLELKEGCVEFMLKNLSLEIFCDFAALSVLYNELELLEATEKFFVENSKAIVETDGWHNCLRENPVAANYFVEKLLHPEVCDEKKRKKWNPEKKKKKLQSMCSF